LHQRRYYPRHDKLDETPETKCAYLDVKDKDKDKDVNFIGCQRRYFMSMSKAMATKCSGEVFMMTMADLDDPKIDVPEDGIWWQVEFPTLIDEKNRAQDKKITKVSTFALPRSWTPPRQRLLTISRRSHTSKYPTKLPRSSKNCKRSHIRTEKHPR
jgi:hypothetical protein